jgi:hypothetical protein
MIGRLERTVIGPSMIRAVRPWKLWFDTSRWEEAESGRPRPDASPRIPREGGGGGGRRRLILGLILLIIGWLTGIGLLVTLGIILLIIGAVLWILGSTGRPVGGRRYWW